MQSRARHNRAGSCLEGDVGGHGGKEAIPVERRLLCSGGWWSGDIRACEITTHTACNTGGSRTEKEASATPATMGTRVASSGRVGVEPRNSQDMMTLKNGSIAWEVRGWRVRRGGRSAFHDIVSP